MSVDANEKLSIFMIDRLTELKYDFELRKAVKEFDNQELCNHALFLITQDEKRIWDEIEEETGKLVPKCED